MKLIYTSSKTQEFQSIPQVTDHLQMRFSCTPATSSLFKAFAPSQDAGKEAVTETTEQNHIYC